MIKLYVKSNREERKKLIELIDYFDKWILCYQESNPVIKENIAQLNDKDKNDLLLRIKKLMKLNRNIEKYFTSNVL